MSATTATLVSVVVKHPGEPARVQSIPRRSTQLSKVIHGSPAQCLRFIDEPRKIDLTGWCDDDGIEKELPINFARPTDGAEIRGPVVITSRDFFEDGPDWAGLSADEIREALELLGAIAP